MGARADVVAADTETAGLARRFDRPCDRHRRADHHDAGTVDKKGTADAKSIKPRM